MADQPSKESLERANEVWSQMSFLREERQIETLALEFDTIVTEERDASEILRVAGDELIKENKELRQQNAALVRALRTAIGYSFHRFVCAFKLHPPDKCNCGFQKMLDDMDVLLAPLRTRRGKGETMNEWADKFRHYSAQLRKAEQ